MFSFALRSVCACSHNTAWCATLGMLPSSLISPFARADNASVKMTLPAVPVNATSDSVGVSDTVICALDQEISQLEPEVEKLARNKQRIDELIGEHLAALNVARDQICSLNRSISEANELQQQLASAQNSYERKRVHEQCESRFKTGYPLEIVRECRWKLTKVTRDVEKLEQRIHSIIKRASMNVEHVVFDGNNFCYERKRFIGLTALFSAVKTIAQKHAVTVIFDSSIRCHLKKSNGEIRGLFPKGVHVSIVPTRTKADETMLTIAKDAGYYVLSNNHFADFPDMPAVHDKRILRHQIVNGRVMIFDLDVDIALGDTSFPGPPRD